MATETDTEVEESRYEHEIEGLDDLPEEESGYELVDEEEAPREAAGDEEEEEEDEEKAKPPNEEEEEEEDIEADIREALQKQESAQTREETEALKREVADLREKLSQRETAEKAQTQQREAETKISDLRRRLKKASEDGETETVLDLQEQLVDAKVELREAQRAEKTPDTERGKQPPVQTRRPEAPAAAYRWLQRNPWYAKGEKPEANETAGIIEQRLIARGMNPASDEFYKVLDKQLRRFHPELKEKEDEGGRKRTARGPTNGVSKAGNRKSGKVRLTKADTKFMAECGLDPENPEHLKQYALEKKALEAQERR